MHEEVAKIREDVAFIRATLNTRLDSLETQIQPITKIYNFFQGVGKALGIAALIATIVAAFHKVFK